MRHARTLFCAATAVWLSACATSNTAPATSVATAPPAARPVPAYLTADKGCAVVAGGAIGSQFADPKITSFWHTVNGEITAHLHERLAADHYRVVKLVVPTEEALNNEKVVVRSLAANRCSRLIQVWHTVDEDKGGKFFRFDVVAMRMQPKAQDAVAPGGTQVTTVGEFKREYRFARNAEVFKSFQTGQFAGTVAQDLQRSGVLEPLR
ncbi:MAG TPA: hypothetical protein VFO28_04395 [Burkholderiaceae bacterium]|nr:hypothetical protein [Burkholderiaceae bacterium]